MRMRVPARYSSVEPRKEIVKSLKTGDEMEADDRLVIVRRQELAKLDAKLAGLQPAEESHYEAIARLAASRGVPYRTADELAAGPLEELLRRIGMLRSGGDDPNNQSAAALLGGVKRPSMSITDIANKMEKWYPLEVRDKNEKQRMVWRSRWTRPAAKVVELLGFDPAFDGISRAEAISLRDALQDRVIDGDMKGASAQKELQNLNLLWEKWHLYLALLRKSPDDRGSPFPGQTYPTASVTGMPSAV